VGPSLLPSMALEFRKFVPFLTISLRRWLDAACED
jgi:hypothetical protein